MVAKRNKQTDKNSSKADDIISDAIADDLIDNAFPTEPLASTEVTYRSLLTAIPGEAFDTTAQEFTGFLEGLFETEEELETTLNRCLSPSTTSGGAAMVRQVRALVPAELLGGYGASGFIDQVFSAFDEIEEVLKPFRTEVSTGSSDSMSTTMAIVPESVLADPAELIRAIDLLEDEAQKLDILFRQAKHVLHKLRAYRLTKRSTGNLLSEMRSNNHIPTLQYVVDFLRSIQQAATNFEKLELPRPHIRDYLEHLYHLKDWESMAELVRRFEEAVPRYSEEDDQATSSRILNSEF